MAIMPAQAWGPAGQSLQAVAIVTSTDLLRQLAAVNPCAAEVLAAFLPGREPATANIAFGRQEEARLPTSATVELVIRGVKDPAILEASRAPPPDPAGSARTTWHSNWTGAGDLEVTFVSRLNDRTGAGAGGAFPAVTVRISSGDPAIVTGWRRADAQEADDPAPQGQPAPVPGQMVARVPVTLEPLSAIRAYSQALVRQDLATVTALTAPGVVDSLGGQDKTLAWWQQRLVMARLLHEWPVAEQINDIRRLAAPGTDLYVVQSTRWFEGWPKPRGMSWVYLLCTRDKGRHWEVVDLAGLDRRWLRTLAPQFTDDASVADLLPN